jgi:hypothetical protein
MQYPSANSMPANAIPTTTDMLRVWHNDRCLRDSSAGVYLQWIGRFRAYCASHKLNEWAELTLEGRIDSSRGTPTADILILATQAGRVRPCTR